MLGVIQTISHMTAGVIQLVILCHKLSTARLEYNCIFVFALVI